MVSHRHALQRSTLFVAIIAVLTVVSVGCSDEVVVPMPSETTMPTPPEMNIAYGPHTGCDATLQDQCGGSQTLDIYRATGVTPETRTDGEPRKVAIWVHGGGFIGGDKIGSVSKYLGGLLDDGWDLVSVNHRLSSDSGNHFPVPLMDVKRAVRWVKVNAAEQGWDPDQVAAIGHSAGGNLVEMLAVTADRPELEDPTLPSELRTVDSSVTSAVGLAAVSDLRAFRDSNVFPGVVETYIGCSGRCDEQLEAGSVQTYVNGDSAPIMAIHGSRDEVAAPSQGQLLKDTFVRAGMGNRFKLIVVDDGPKGFQGHIPDMERWIGDVTDWLDSHVP